MHYVKSYDIAGYTHSDGYCLCVNHGTDDKGNELPDAGNETGKVFPIFEGAETDRDMVCDVCYDELFASGGDVRDAIILEANIDVEEDESEKDPEEEEDDSFHSVPLSVIKEFVASQHNIEFWVQLHDQTNYHFTDGEPSLALVALRFGDDLYSVTVDPSMQNLWNEAVARYRANEEQE